MKQKVKNFVRKLGPIYYFLRKLVYRRRLLKRKPEGLDIELTNRCNLRCNYCPKSKGYNSGVEGDMDFDFFKKIIDEAFQVLNLKQVGLTGFGEPFLFPFIFEAIEYVKNKSPKIKVSITTNGILLTEETGKKIINSGLDSLSISINFFNREKYKKWSNFDFYDLVVKNAGKFLTLLRKEKSNKPKVYVQILDTVNTNEEIEEFKKYWSPQLVFNSEIQIQPFVNWGGIINNLRERERGDYILQERYPCGHLGGSVINKDGDVLACCMAFPLSQNDKTLVLGNLKEQSLLLCCCGEKIKKLRKMNVEGKLEQLPLCSKCDAWKTSINVWFKNKLFKGIRKWI